MRLFIGLAACLHVANPAYSGTDITALTPREREAFRAEVRKFLLANPEIIDAARAVPDYTGLAYAEEAAADKVLIASVATRLFDPALPGFGPPDAPVRIAFLTAPDCAACPAALVELQALAERFPLHVSLVDVRDSPDIPDALEIDLLPAYIFDDLMVRGHVPPVVLERYVDDRIDR